MQSPILLDGLIQWPLSNREAMHIDMDVLMMAACTRLKCHLVSPGFWVCRTSQIVLSQNRIYTSDSLAIIQGTGPSVFLSIHGTESFFPVMSCPLLRCVQVLFQQMFELRDCLQLFLCL